MRPIDFAEANRTLLKPEGMTEEECGSLPVFVQDGIVTSCWKATFKERLMILLFGKVWLWVYSGNTQPPVALDGKRTVFVKNNGEGVA